MNTRWTVVVAISLLGLFMNSLNALESGDAAPVLTATDQDGKIIDLGDAYKKGLTLVYFYPKSDTPGCTAQACSLRDSYDDLISQGLQIIGVSKDEVAAQKAFQEKYKLPFPLIADTDGAVAKAFGVSPESGGKRQSFLIKDGKIAWHAPKASTENHAADVRQAIESVQ